MTKDNVVKIALILCILFSLKSFARSRPGDIVHYSEAVDVFEITDNLSMWHKNSLGRYKEYWKENLELNTEDETMLHKYAKIRTFYHKKFLKNLNRDLDDSLFSNAHIPLDPFSLVFYDSWSISEAIRKLKKHLHKDEIKFLVKFYKHFKSRITKLVKESTLFADKIKIFNRDFKKSSASKVMRNAGKFLGINKRIQKKNKIYFVWYPPNVAPLQTVYQNKVILRYHPIHRLKDLDKSEVMNALVLSFINSLSVNKRVNLSKQFLGKCNVDFMSKRLVLERPLAMSLGAIYYESVNKKKKFKIYKEWSLHPWVNSYVKLLYPLISQHQKNRSTLAGSFIDDASSICQELLVFGKFFSAFNK